jgi:hypothetical protein
VAADDVAGDLRVSFLADNLILLLHFSYSGILFVALDETFDSEFGYNFSNTFVGLEWTLLFIHLFDQPYLPSLLSLRFFV